MWIAINNSKSLIVKSWLSQDGGRGTSNWVHQFLKNIKIWTNLAKASIYVFDTYKRVLSISGTILCKLKIFLKPISTEGYKYLNVNCFDQMTKKDMKKVNLDLLFLKAFTHLYILVWHLHFVHRVDAHLLH